MFGAALLLRRTNPIQAVIDGVVWLGTAWLTMFLLWPALWLQPLRTIQLMRIWATTYAINPHANGQYFLGQAIDDPGALYYVVVGAFALTPLVILGLIAILVVATWKLRNVHLYDYLPFQINKSIRRGQRSDIILYLLLITYVIAYTVGISLGEKKQDRYLLPAIMMLNVVAALGLVNLIDLVAVRVGTRNIRTSIRAFLFPVIVIATQLFTVIPYAPYYRSYANPLIGGVTAKAWAIKTGDGEGMELAAEWLNQQPDTKDKTVVATQPGVFYPFFTGETQRWSAPADIFAADYAVIYRSSWQQGHPHPDLMTYVRETWPLLHTVTLYGEDFAWIYKPPQTTWVLPRDMGLQSLQQNPYLAYNIEMLPNEDHDVVGVTLYHWAIHIENDQERLAIQASPDTEPSILNLVSSHVTETDAGSFAETSYEAEVPHGQNWQNSFVLIKTSANNYTEWQPIGGKQIVSNGMPSR